MSKQVLILIVLAGVMIYSFVPRKPSAPPGNIAWRTDADVALKESTGDGKPTLVVFTASWCPPCQQMKRESWPAASVAEAAKRYNTVWVDIDNYGALAQQYDVQGIPTVVKLDDDLREQSRFSGFVDAGELASWLGR